MGDLSNIEEVAKYAARMGQCFLGTRAMAYLPVNDIQRINDIMRNDSPALCQEIAEVLELKSTPFAVQFRLGGCKSVLWMCQCVNVSRGNQIQVRPSQSKFNSLHTELEVIRASTFLPSHPIQY